MTIFGKIRTGDKNDNFCPKYELVSRMFLFVDKLSFRIIENSIEKVILQTMNTNPTPCALVAEQNDHFCPNSEVMTKMTIFA